MSNVTLKVRIQNFSVEVSGDSVYAEGKLHELIERYSSFAMKSFALSPEKGALPMEVVGMASPRAVDKKVSHGEFLKKVSPKTQMERALVLGYYLEKHAMEDGFTSADLVAACKAAKQSAFSNVSDCVGKLISQGLFMVAGEKEGVRSYSLTSTGEVQVEASLV